jgi:hypothetical protein
MYIKLMCDSFEVNRLYKIDELELKANAPLIWTVRPIIHSDVNPDTALSLGVRKVPLVADVIKHLQNVIRDLAPNWQSYHLLVGDLDTIVAQILK